MVSVLVSSSFGSCGSGRISHLDDIFQETYAYTSAFLSPEIAVSDISPKQFLNFFP